MNNRYACRGIVGLLFLIFLPSIIWGWVVWWTIVGVILGLYLLWKGLKNITEPTWDYKPEPLSRPYTKSYRKTYRKPYRKTSKKTYRKTYIDDNGYKRFKDSKKLVHRQVAFTEVFDFDLDKYPLNFREYQVHHKDGNKLNNKKTNLQILTRAEHKSIHGLL